MIRVGPTLSEILKRGVGSVGQRSAEAVRCQAGLGPKVLGAAASSLPPAPIAAAESNACVMSPEPSSPSPGVLKRLQQLCDASGPTIFPQKAFANGEEAVATHTCRGAIVWRLAHGRQDEIRAFLELGPLLASSTIHVAPRRGVPPPPKTPRTTERITTHTSLCTSRCLWVPPHPLACPPCVAWVCLWLVRMYVCL